jgi:hypothetical protein
MKFFKENSRISLLIIVILLTTILIVAKKQVFVKSTIDQLANQVIKTCAASSSKQRCYDTAIPKLMKSITMEEAFAVTKIVQSKDREYWFCHALGHNISAQEYKKDPSKWKEIMTRCPVGMCSNGCIHGALQEHFSAEWLNETQLEKLLPDVKDICEPRKNWEPTQLAVSSCYHEIGHLSLYLTNGDIKRAQGVCDTVGVKPDGRNYLQTCYEGIFMQIFEPREPEDFALIYSLIPRKEKLSTCEQYTTGIDKGACWKSGWEGKEKEFCNTFANDLRYACYREAWVINDASIETPEGIISYCNYSDDAEEKRKCYNKLYYSLMSKYEFDHTRLEKLCAELPQDLRGQCFGNTASRLIETDKTLWKTALSVCDKAKIYKVEGVCFAELAHYGQIAMAGSKEGKFLCNGLPEPWKALCKRSN